MHLHYQGEIMTPTSTLFFFLYAPENGMYRFTKPGKAFTEEAAQSLTFENRNFTKIRLGKGIGDIILHREIPNWKTGDEFATEWKTKNIAEEGYDGLRFSIFNRTPIDDAKMLAWNKEHPDDLYTDCVAIDHGVEAHVCLYVSHDRFHDLLNLNWRERYLEVLLDTCPSIRGLTFSLEERVKTKMREGTFYSDSAGPLTHRRLVVYRYEMNVKDLPVLPPQERGHPSFIRNIRCTA